MKPLDYRHAIYAGSFDPITLGHTAIIERALRVYDRVTVAIGSNPSKKGLFSLEERQKLIEASLSAPRMEVVIFNGLLVAFAQQIGAGVLLRGLRLLADFEHEFQLALANRDLAPGLETVFMMTEPNHVYVSSSLVKEIAMNGGGVGRFVPAAVQQALAAKYPSK
ncbi:MAG: pantetheine-phosphate adenylyltransferase [Deltaproteobacteria bacterium]|nr:pantetheine-phosphate adenylyltransferase [Deltaproteobacteria bacterium]